MKILEYQNKGVHLIVYYKIEKGCSATNFHPGDSDDIGIVEIKDLDNNIITEKQLSSEEFNNIIDKIQE